MQLTNRAAVTFIWLYFAMNALLALWTLEHMRSPWPTIVALVLFATVCLAVSLDRGDRLSPVVSIFIMIAGPATVLFVSWHVVDGGYTTWYIGTGTVALFFMCLRGRVAWAWVGFAALVLSIAVWGFATDTGQAMAIAIVARQVPVLIVGTLGAIGLDRTGDDIERMTAQASARVTAEAASVAAAAERALRLTELEHSVGSLLNRIANGERLSAEDRRECGLAEAGLRDTLRARAMCVPPLLAAAREARRRGVEVVLLDDSEPSTISASDLADFITVASGALDAATDGRVTARLLPSGRSSIGTVVADGAAYIRHDVERVSV